MLTSNLLIILRVLALVLVVYFLVKSKVIKFTPVKKQEKVFKQSILIHLDGIGLSDEVYKNYDLATLEDRINNILQKDGLGICDGNEMGPTGTTVYIYAEDAEKSFFSIEKTIRNYPLCKNSRVTIRKDESGLGDREILIDKCEINQMSKSLQKLYPKESEARDNAWTSLEEVDQIQLRDISFLLETERRLLSAINNGRTDLQLEAASNLNSKEGKDAAIKWFHTQKSMLQIANQNMQKTSHLRKDPTKEISPGKQELFDRIINTLQKAI